MSRAMKLQVFIDGKAYQTVINFMQKNHIRTESEAVWKIIREYDRLNEDWDTSINRLNSALLKKDENIKQLEYAVKNIYGKQFKEMNKNE